jgi:predicted outer membrane repeat protein
VSWVILNSLMTGNKAIGWGANPAGAGAPGGGSGAAIYTDGDQYTLTVAGAVVEGNTARQGGGALFFVSNDDAGT